RRIRANIRSTSSTARRRAATTTISPARARRSRSVQSRRRSVATTDRPDHGAPIVPRRILTAIVFAAGVCLVTPGRTPSAEDMFVAPTAAAEETEGAMCLMPEGAAGAPAAAGRAPTAAQGQPQIAFPTRSDAEGGDLPPVRMVVDPYPSFNGVVVDS